MKLSFAVLAATMVLALSVSAAPTPQNILDGIADGLNSAVDATVDAVTGTVDAVTGLVNPATPPAPTPNAPPPPPPAAGSERFQDKKSAESGGGGGERFDDTNGLPADITKVNRIIIQGGERVDSIQMNLSGATGDVNLVHGGGGGNNRQTIDLAAGEKIITVVVWTDGDRITGMRVGTTNPANTRFVGTRVGAGIPSQSPGPEFEVIGFFGRSGAGIDSIGAIWGIVNPA